MSLREKSHFHLDTLFPVVSNVHYKCVTVSEMILYVTINCDSLYVYEFEQSFLLSQAIDLEFNLHCQLIVK